MPKPQLERCIHHSSLPHDASPESRKAVGYLLNSYGKTAVEEQLTLDGKIDFIYYTKKGDNNESK